MLGGGRGGAAEGRRGRAGADFSPVASGLRQFVFLPRLESRGQAFQKSQNRNRAGWHIADRKRGPFSSPFRCRCRSVDRAVSSGSLVPGSFQVNLSGVLSAPRTEHAENMAPITTSRVEFGEQVDELGAVAGFRAVLCFALLWMLNMYVFK